MQVLNLDPDIPSEIEVDWYDLEGAEQLKRFKEDNLIEGYYSDTFANEAVVRVGESEGFDEPILEKKMKTDTELPYTLLIETLGVGPEVYYVRENDYGDQIIGMEFLADYGMVEDLNYDGFDAFLDYACSIGNTLGSIWDVGIMHDDITRTEAHGDFANTHYVANVMLKGADDDARLIDFERTVFEDEYDDTQIGTNMRETVEEEMMSVESALLSEAARSFSDQINNLYLTENEDITDYFISGNNMVRQLDVESLPSPLDEIFREIRTEFRKGVADGNVNPIRMQEYFKFKTIPEPEVISTKDSEKVAKDAFNHIEQYLQQ